MSDLAMAETGPLSVKMHSSLAKPIHIQKLEEALDLQPFLGYIENVLHDPKPSDVETSDGDTDWELKQLETDEEGNKIYNGIVISKSERKTDKARLYNFSKIKKSRRWLKTVLLSDTSSDDDDLGGTVSRDGQDSDNSLRKDHLHDLLKMHVYQKQQREKFAKDREMQQFEYYSVGLLSNYDRFYDHQKMVLGPRRKAMKEQRKLEKKLKKAKMNTVEASEETPASEAETVARFKVLEKGRPQGICGMGGRNAKGKKLTPEQLAAKRRRLWVGLVKKELPKAQKQKVNARRDLLTLIKKASKECQKECRRAGLQSQKMMKEAAIRARRLSKEMMVYWKRFEKVEKEHRKKAEKEAQEQRRMDYEILEMKRQQRKLNFLITQTELYAHFMAKKMTGATEADRDAILRRLEEDGDESDGGQREVNGSVIQDVIGDSYDSAEMKALALRNAEEALQSHVKKKRTFDGVVGKGLTGEAQNEALSLANPAISTEAERPQANIFAGKLKSYQLKGMNWLANLYDQGINGILADEMGLGKTVQTIAFLAHLAENYNVWGPFLVVAPASTLHNWQQEVTRFMPAMKVVPYWGNTQDRKILRKFWNQENLHMRHASFHIVVTSYQLVIQDLKYFQRIKWHYMILDEAQALKSTSSVRWKILLGFNCRNRLLLTGTPIQNTMAELWALLHFIMPTLFDSHDEFNEWFSKDIESHAERQSGIDQDQLSRLHMILKPFMLRRVKKDVENELSDKIEILVYCPLKKRQRQLYQGIKNKISIEDLLQSYATSSTLAQSSASSLMNLVMQFRKVCNHPELFERREVRSPFFMRLDPYVIPKLVYRDGILTTAIPSRRRLLYNTLYIFNPCHVHRSLFHTTNTERRSLDGCCFAFTRLLDMSPSDLEEVLLKGLLFRWLTIILLLRKACQVHHQREWQADLVERETRYFRRDEAWVSPSLGPSPAVLATSPALRGLVFTSPASAAHAFLPHVVHSIPETASHRKIRIRRLTGKGAEPLSPTHPKSPLGSPKKAMLVKKIILDSEEYVHKHVPRPPRIFQDVLTELPSFLYKTMPKAHASSLACYTSDRSAQWEGMRQRLCGTLEARQTLLYGDPHTADRVRWGRHYFRPTPPQGLLGIQPRHGYSGVSVPNKETLVTDAGKLSVLDLLLQKLKSEDHRVLIYSQMTRMIDILEEYMWHRKHTYMRLDGSSKISERRDMVADFQSNSDIFVFLLSTRAGGLGINLTAADTVIFYDSDWNPTVDQQAMDRAHRLGQTKQVTVYRLICKGSIEERILQRAREKSEIQRMVISGGNFRPDVLRPKEVVSLLLDDDDMERKLRMRQDEKKQREENYKEKGRERYKRKQQATGGTGRPRGRPPKKKKLEESQLASTPGGVEDSNLSMDSFSVPASPLSVMSAGSESTQMSMGLGIGDESSNEGLIIVDDASNPFAGTGSPAAPPVKARRGRPRGRPKGSGLGRRRGRGSVQKAISAAEAAAAQAGKTAAYAAYGYSLGGDGSPAPRSEASTPTPLNKGASFRPRLRGRGSRGPRGSRSRGGRGGSRGGSRGAHKLVS